MTSSVTNSTASVLEPQLQTVLPASDPLGLAGPQLDSQHPSALPITELGVLSSEPTGLTGLPFSVLMDDSLLPPSDASMTALPIGLLPKTGEPIVGGDVFFEQPDFTDFIDPAYTSGYFFTDYTGNLGIDYLFDGGGYQGQLALFSLEGMEAFEPGSHEFIQEAARRALSNSELGYVAIDDLTEGARFDGKLGEKSQNSGDYQGVKQFTINPNGHYAFMLVPNGLVADVLKDPAVGGDKRPLFSLVTANPNAAFHIGQLADVVGDGTTFVFEDLRMDQGSDRDYNDLIFRVQGATGYAALMDDVIAPGKTWKHSVLGQQVLAYVQDFKDATKPIPGNPTYPALPVPQVPLPTVPITPVDQGGNSAVIPTNPALPEPTTPQPNPGGAIQTAPTPIQSSATTDVIDQVSASDPIDTYQVPSQQLMETEISVLTGAAAVTVLNNQGEVLSQQSLSKGNHTLTLPEGTTGEVVVQVKTLDNTNATYVLNGFESKAEEPYNVAVEFGEGISDSQKTIIQEAARSIEALISQGLPSAIVDGKIIDDINFKISAVDLDGVDGTLAETKIDFMRYGSLLPAQSITRFDRADLDNLEKTGQLFSVVQHEMLHGLGFGNLWEAKGLVEYTKTPFSRYVGEQAVAAFQELGGATDSIPLELEGNGSADMHWNESLFQDEVMTRNLNFQSVGTQSNMQPGIADALAPISPVTLASLADLGYQVNLNQSSSDWRLLGSTNSPNIGANPLATALLTDPQAMEEVQQAFEFLATSPYVSAFGDDIPTVIPPVDPSTIAPTNWAHAERFDVNGEYYDWELITVGHWTNGHTVWNYVLDRMTHSSKLDGRSANAKANDPRYWQFVVDRNRGFGITRPNLIYENGQLYLPVWNENYEWEQEQERLRREEELRKKQEEEKRERDRQLEAYRQAGSGGLEWFLAKSLPDFGRVAPFESNVRDVVGNLVPDDYFRFTLDRPGWVTVYLEDLLADADLYLYDSRNRLMGQANRPGLTDEKIIMNLTPGTYLVRVNSPAGVTTDYNLKVRFDGLPTRTQVGAGTGRGGKKATFSDPRIESIFAAAVNKFSAAQWAAAQPQIDRLEAEKRQKQQEADALLQQAIAQQKAKIYGELDTIRNGARQSISNKADDIKHGVYWVADRAKNIVNGAIPGWVMDGLNKIGLGDQVRNAQNSLKDKIDEARNWLNSQVDRARNSINDLIWQFNEMVKNAYVTGGEINQAIDNAANWLKGKTDELVNWLSGKVDEVKGRILGAMQWTRDIRTPDWAKRWLGLPDWNLYDNVVAGVVNDVAGGIQNTVRSIGDGFKHVVNGVTPLVQGAVAIIVDAIFGDQTGKLYNQIKGIDQKIANIRAGVEKAISNQTARFKADLNGMLGKLGIDGKKIFDTLMDFSNSPTAQIGMAVLEVILGLIPGVGQAIDIKDTAISLYDILVQGKKGVADLVGLIGALAGWVPGLGDAIKSVAKIAMKGADFLVPILKNLGPDVTETVIKTVSDLDWGKLLTDVVGDITRRWDDVLRVFDGSAGWILDALNARPAIAMAGGVMLNFRKGADDVAGNLKLPQKQLLQLTTNGAKKSLWEIWNANRGRLRTNLGNPVEVVVPSTNKLYPSPLSGNLSKDYQAHHLITIPNSPEEVHDLVRVGSRFGYDINNAKNGIYLPTTQEQAELIYQASGMRLPVHSGGHKAYSDFIRHQMDDKWLELEQLGLTNNHAAVLGAIDQVTQDAVETVLYKTSKIE